MEVGRLPPTSSSKKPVLQRAKVLRLDEASPEWSRRALKVLSQLPRRRTYDYSDETAARHANRSTGNKRRLRLQMHPEADIQQARRPPTPYPFEEALVESASRSDSSRSLDAQEEAHCPSRCNPACPRNASSLYELCTAVEVASRLRESIEGHVGDSDGASCINVTHSRSLVNDLLRQLLDVRTAMRNERDGAAGALAEQDIPKPMWLNGGESDSFSSASRAGPGTHDVPSGFTKVSRLGTEAAPASA